MEVIGITEYYDTKEGLLFKNNKGKTTVQNMLLEYFFKGKAKKKTSPRFIDFRGTIRGMMLVTHNNRNVSFYIYVNIDGIDIRFQFPLELMKLLVDARQSMVFSESINDAMWNMKDCSLDLSRLYYSPKLEECLFGERKILSEEDKKVIMVKNAPEIFNLKTQRERTIEAFLNELDQKENELAVVENPKEEIAFGVGDDEEPFDEIDFEVDLNEYQAQEEQEAEQEVIDREQAIIAFLEEEGEKENA